MRFRKFFSRNRSGAKKRVQWRLNEVELLEARCLLTVPAFSSLPGADHTIFLDYDGHVTENTPWNNYFKNPSINSPAYDIDGDPSTFNATELARIEESWSRIAEDFFPFEVNVTTVDPGVEALRKSGAGDTQWGIRTVITADTEGCGCGGIAYINSFNWSNETPVFVYTKGGKSIAAAGSHEVGHSLGLSHDGNSSTSYYRGHGSGETGWAPIMGVGYYRNVTTWDKGEYYGSNNGGARANYNKGPDDLDIITTRNGFAYRNDDHGDLTADATPLDVSGLDVSGSGFIGTTSDVDVFSFVTGSGDVTINIDPFTPGPNLDIKVDLYNSIGTLIDSSNPTSVLGASFSRPLSAGQYFLHVDGTGVGDPTTNPPTGYTDYASLGQFTISGTVVDPSEIPEFSIDDVVVNEGDGFATFTVTLAGNIVEPATVDFSTLSGTAIAGTDFVTTSGSLTFNIGDLEKTVVVEITDDSIAENQENFFLDLSSPSLGVIIADDRGEGFIIDNDTAGVIIDPIAGLETTEAGGTAEFTVVLTSEPIQQVEVVFASDDLSEGNLQNAINDEFRVVFTATNWNQPVTVVVVGQDDSILDGDIPYNIISRKIISLDSKYDGLDPDDVALVNLDDDVVRATFFSVETSAVLQGVPFDNEDIIQYFDNFFDVVVDGSDIGLTNTSIDGFHIESASSILMSFGSSFTTGFFFPLPGLAPGTFVDDSDILKFIPTALGTTTSGNFEVFFDGSAANLTTSSENVDAVTLLSDGRLAVSTSGNFSVPGVSGVGQDLIAFTPNIAGDYTSGGTWEMFFDGSTERLTTSGELVDGASVEDTSLFLSTEGSFDVLDVAGADEDIFVYQIPSGNYSNTLHFDGSTLGLASNDLTGLDLLDGPLVEPGTGCRLGERGLFSCDNGDGGGFGGGFGGFGGGGGSPGAGAGNGNGGNGSGSAGIPSDPVTTFASMSGSRDHNDQISEERYSGDTTGMMPSLTSGGFSISESESVPLLVMDPIWMFEADAIQSHDHSPDHAHDEEVNSVEMTSTLVTTEFSDSFSTDVSDPGIDQFSIFNISRIDVTDDLLKFNHKVADRRDVQIVVTAKQDVYRHSQLVINDMGLFEIEDETDNRLLYENATNSDDEGSTVDLAIDEVFGSNDLTLDLMRV